MTREKEVKHLLGGSEILLDVFGGKSVGEAIEAQEARGQRRMITRSRLPRKLDERLTAKEAYEKMGIKVIGEADDLFYDVELPEGWKIDASSHSMWSNLLDTKGQVRATIFYKAAFYDRDAFIVLKRRFTYKVEPEDKYETNISYADRQGSSHYGIVYDRGVEIWRTSSMTIVYSEDRFHWFYEQTAKRDKYFLKLCRAFLEGHFPDYENFFAYWD